MKSNLWAIARQTLRVHKWEAVGLGMTVCAVVALSLLPPQLLRLLIDRCLLPKNGALIGPLAAAYLLLLVLTGGFDFLRGVLLTRIGQDLICRLRMRMMRKVDALPSTYFSKNATGRIVSRFTADVENVNALFTEGVISMAIDCLKIIGIVVSVFVFSWKLGIGILILAPALYAVTRLFQKKLLEAQVKNLEQLGNVNNHIAESMKNIVMVKLLSKEHYMGKTYEEQLLKNYDTKQRVNILDSSYSPMIQLLRAVAIAAVVMLCTSSDNVLGISVGALTASIELITNLLSPIEALGMEIQNVQKGLSGIERLEEFLGEPEEKPKDGSLTADRVLHAASSAELEFYRLSFSYVPGQPVLQDVSFDLKGNIGVSFVGRTGVGKTTLFNLIMGLLQPTEGKILLNGFSVGQIPNEEKRKLFGYVEQNFHFIEGTIADQVSLGDPDISREQVERACRFVGLHETILAREKGYDTVLRGGGSFSWGQRQLLAIARAIVADPPLLLLDEMTANLDSATEKQIVAVLQNTKQSRMILSISHRMAAMIGSDRVITLHNGTVKS